MYPVPIVKRVVIQSDIAAKSRRIPDESAPIAVVIKYTGGLVVSRPAEPVLQLVLKAGLKIVQSARVAGDFCDRKQMSDATQVFSYIVGVCTAAALTHGKMIGFARNRIDEGIQGAVVEIARVRHERKDAVISLDD